MSSPTRITIWNEYLHEQQPGAVQQVYPDGIHMTLVRALAPYGFAIQTATLEQPEHGLPPEVLDATDVLIWWGHAAHKHVSDTVVDRVQQRVLDGMGLIVLHSGHHSKIFKRLMGTTCHLKWREGDDNERLWVVAPGHPIAEGLGETIEIEREEMYGELFDVPPPETLVFISWFKGGEVFRSGCCYTRGRGKIFYFRPGHESYPTYHLPDVQRVIANACYWAAPGDGPRPVFGNRPPLEK